MLRSLLTAGLCLCVCGVTAAPPIVSNVVTAQRMDGPDLLTQVDVTYNVSDADGDTLTVWVEFSNDNGRTFSIAPTTVSGDIGSVTPGTGKLLTWDAGADLPGLDCGDVIARVYADDGTGEGVYGEMVFVPADSGDIFTMGYGGDNGKDYYPSHEVYLDSYFIGKYEVTRREYRAFLASGGYKDSSYWSVDGWAWVQSSGIQAPANWGPNQSWGTQTNDAPVVGVSYYEAEAYCNWLGARLPTEAEWEKAAGWDNGTKYNFPWGNAIGEANHCNHRTDGQFDIVPAPIGSYPSGVSPYGLHDCSGNAAEWVYDWYDQDYYDVTPPGGWVNPTGPASGTQRVYRGGDWSESYDSVNLVNNRFTTFYRNRTSPTVRTADIGFRVVLDP